MPIIVRKGMVMPWEFRFVPDDLKLVSYYLRRRIANLPLDDDAIFEYDVYSTEPWNVPDVYGPGEINKNAPWKQPEPKKIVQEGYKGFYFVRSGPKRKQNLCTVIKSGTGGYWKKVNCGHRDVRDERNMLVGLKRTFVFHRYTTKNKDHAEKTDWILNEYSLNSKKYQPWVLCSVRNKREYSEAYAIDDEDEEFLQQDESITELIDDVKEIDINNIEPQQQQFGNADNGDIMEEEEEEIKDSDKFM